MDLDFMIGKFEWIIGWLGFLLMMLCDKFYEYAIHLAVRWSDLWL